MAKEKFSVLDQLEADTVLWSDRKRWLGMPLTFTKYTVDNDRLYVKTGFFKSEMNELLLYRVLDLKLIRTFGQKLTGVGSVILYCTDQSHHTLELKNIKKPEKIYRFLSELVEQRRNEKGITGRELYGTGSLGQEHDDCDHPVPPFADMDN